MDDFIVNDIENGYTIYENGRTTFYSTKQYLIDAILKLIG
jgi:hypothetical protein